MIKHIVTWKLKETNSLKKVEQANMIKQTLEALKPKIKEIIYLEIGLDCNSYDESNWDITLISEFESFNTLKAYIKHPDHQEVVAKIKPYFSGRVCVDYEI